MANEQNLRPSEHKFTQEEAKKGGINSAKARREKKTTQKIIADLVAMQASNIPALAKAANKAGLGSDKTIHEVVSAIYLLNSLKNGNLSDLERLSKLLGEENSKETNNGILDDLAEYLKNDE